MPEDRIAASMQLYVEKQNDLDVISSLFDFFIILPSIYSFFSFFCGWYEDYSFNTS